MSSPCNALERNCGGLPRCLYYWFPVLSRVAKMRMSQVVCFLKTATKYRALVNFCVFATLYKIPYLRLWSHQEQWWRSWHRRFLCQGRSIPTQDHGEPKRKLCHHDGDRPLGDSFIPMPMESPRGPGALSSSWNFAEETIWFSHLFVCMCATVIFDYLKVCVSLLSRDKD